MVYYSGLGAARKAVATMCRPGEIMTRDGCEPDSRGEYSEAPRENCGPGTYWYEPTASCRPVDCPDGFALDSTGQCVPLEREPKPEPVEFVPVITDGDPIIESTALIQPEAPSSDPGTVVDPGASGGGTGLGPAPWGAPPELVVQFGPEGEGPPSWWDDGDAAAPSSSSSRGFGMLEAGVGALVAFLIGQAFTRGRKR